MKKKVNKRKISKELIVLGIFLFSIAFLILFGKYFTGFAVFEGQDFKGKIEIQVGNSYKPGENINFGIILYDEDNDKINDKINFEIQNFYTEIVQKGVINSGEQVSFKLPNNAMRGHWAVIAKYGNIEKKELFNVLELEKAEIKLEGDRFVITNIGNVPYRKSIQISIGEYEETALVPLGIGESKEIKLTAPDGEYDIRVSDGTNENTITFSKVSLTGNVVGLNNLSKQGFFKKYPLISLFLVVIALEVIIIMWLNLKDKYRKNSYGKNKK